MARKLPQPNNYLGHDLNSFGKAWDGVSEDYKKVWIVLSWIPIVLLILSFIFMIVGILT